jgi:hypothetical protein
MNIRKYKYIDIICLLVSLLCAFWMYGFFCYMWNGTLHELKFLNPIVQYGLIAPIIGFPVSVYCIIYGKKIYNKILSVILLFFHSFWLFVLISALINKVLTLLY